MPAWWLFGHHHLRSVLVKGETGIWSRLYQFIGNTGGERLKDTTDSAGKFQVVTVLLHRFLPHRSCEGGGGRGKIDRRRIYVSKGTWDRAVGKGFSVGVSECLVSRGRNCLLVLDYFSRMVLEWTDLEDWDSVSLQSGARVCFLAAIVTIMSPSRFAAGRSA